MTPTRAQLQEQIDSLLKNNPGISFETLKGLMGTYLDGFDLDDTVSTHDFIKNHILDDLNSYKLGGVK